MMFSLYLASLLVSLLLDCLFAPSSNASDAASPIEILKTTYLAQMPDFQQYALYATVSLVSAGLMGAFLKSLRG